MQRLPLWVTLHEVLVSFVVELVVEPLLAVVELVTLVELVALTELVALVALLAFMGLCTLGAPVEFTEVVASSDAMF